MKINIRDIINVPNKSAKSNQVISTEEMPFYIHNSVDNLRLPLITV